MPTKNTPSLPKLMLHAEGGAIFLTAIVLYAKLGANGWYLPYYFSHLTYSWWVMRVIRNWVA
jgi:hypothetical protein